MALINVEKKGHILLMGLNRPGKMNAFSLEMLNQLADAYTQLEKDPGLRCGVLFSHGDHFTAGLDLKEVGPHVQEGGHLFDPSKVHPCKTYGQAKTKPVVVAVKGYCLTLGIELILAADICVAHEDTVFAQIEVKRGIYPFGGATFRMPMRCGWGNAMRYLLTGDRFDGKEAYRIGLVQEISDEDPFEIAYAIAQRIAEQAPLGVRATLINAQKGLEQGETAAIKDMIGDARELMESEDAKEGLLSFVERRKAQFTGR